MQYAMDACPSPGENDLMLYTLIPCKQVSQLLCSAKPKCSNCLLFIQAVTAFWLCTAVLCHQHCQLKVGSLRDREVACSASDRQVSNFESCVWRTVSSQSSHQPQEVPLAQFSLYVHKGGLKPDTFHFPTQSVHSIPHHILTVSVATWVPKVSDFFSIWNHHARLS